MKINLPFFNKKFPINIKINIKVLVCFQFNQQEYFFYESGSKFI